VLRGLGPIGGYGGGRNPRKFKAKPALEEPQVKARKANQRKKPQLGVREERTSQRERGMEVIHGGEKECGERREKSASQTRN